MTTESSSWSVRSLFPFFVDSKYGFGSGPGSSLYISIQQGRGYLARGVIWLLESWLDKFSSALRRSLSIRASSSSASLALTLSSLGLTLSALDLSSSASEVDSKFSSTWSFGSLTFPSGNTGRGDASSSFRLSGDPSLSTRVVVYFFSSSSRRHTGE
jgi:hypothetical protein